MKRRIVLMVCFLFAFVSFVMAEDVTLTLEWDANTEEFLGGYGAYVSDAEGGPYEKFADIPVGTETVDYVYDAPAGVATIKFFVVDAHCTIEHHDPILRSGKSNEVNWTYDFLPIVAATELATSMDGDNVTFTWMQADIERVKKWKLYVKEGAAEFAELAEIAYTGQAGPQYTTTEEMNVPDGEMKTFTFALVTFTPTDVFSGNSNEVSITIDKRVVAPVYNVTIKIKVQ